MSIYDFKGLEKMDEEDMLRRILALEEQFKNLDFDNAESSGAIKHIGTLTFDSTNISVTEVEGIYAHSEALQTQIENIFRELDKGYKSLFINVTLGDVKAIMPLNYISGSSEQKVAQNMQWTLSNHAYKSLTSQYVCTKEYFDTNSEEIKDIADGLITLTVKIYALDDITNVENSEVQSDWNQNDETASDYIKNRPFYTMEGEVYFEGSITTTIDEEDETPTPRYYHSCTWDNAELEDVIGEVFDVTFDGTTYPCTMVKLELESESVAMYALYPSEFLEEDITEEDLQNVDSFMVMFTDILIIKAMVVATKEVGTYDLTIAKQGTSVKKIDKKYIPSEYVTISELEALLSSNSVSDLIKQVMQKYLEENPIESVEVDTDLSETSTNPVQNKVVTQTFGKVAEAFELFDEKKADKTNIPTKTSQLENDSGFLTDKPTYTPSEIGAEASGTAQAKVTEHNTSETSHNDIRLLITGLTNRLNALADSDDTTLDQMSEIVDYIKSNKSLIDGITTGKVSVSDIIDNLTTSVSNKPLSAKQGVQLKALIDAIVVPTLLSQLGEDSTHRTVTDTEKEAWNKKSDFSGSYNDLKDKPTIPSLNGYAKTTDIPTKTSQLQNDSNFVTKDVTDSLSEQINDHETDTNIHVTSDEKQAWNNKSNFSGKYADLSGKPTIPTTPSQVGADPSGTAESKVSAHNTSEEAHNDMRLLIDGLTNRLNALANSDDTTLDQMAEVVAYIKNNKSLIDGITTSKVNVSDIIDNLTTSLSNKPLSAKQGVQLKALIDSIVVPTLLSQLGEDSTHRTVTDAEKNTWNNKSNFSGSYNDLTNKPSIPSLSGYATETYVKNYAQPKGNYLTEHQDISGKADKSNAETWTFTLEDGSTVTKKVVLA